MSEYEAAMKRLGRDEVTATFGVRAGPSWEIVGPLNPETTYYALSYGYDERKESFLTDFTVPIIHFNFNKYRSDLPPWDNVDEFVLASTCDGDVVEYTFVESHFVGSVVTGDLKTIQISAEGPITGVDGGIIEKDGVAEKREMGQYSGDTQSFKVTEELT